MKVLFIDVLCGVGSTGRIVTDLANALKTEGHDSLVAFGRGEPKNWDNTYKISNNFDTYYHALMARMFDKCGFYSSGATKKLIKIIREYNPDIIHLHDLHGYYINVKILFKFLKEFNKPVVWTLHDCWQFTGHCAHFDLIGCEKWKTGCYKCPQKKEYPKSIFLDRSKKNFKIKNKYFATINKLTLVTPSLWLKGLTEQSFFKALPIYVINNGIDLNVFYPRDNNKFKSKNNLTDKKIVLGVASEWSRRKGLEDFIKLSELLPKEYKIVLVGLNKKQMKMIPKNIFGIMRTNNADELAEIYSAADVFVNPTYEDNFPTTNLEAQACGVTVITYKTGGSIESVQAENICEKGNVALLAEMIMDVDKNVSKAINVLKFDKERMHSEHQELYNKIIVK